VAGTVFRWAQANTTVVAVICGASLVMYGFYRFSVRTMKFFFNVSDKQIFTIGFVGGMLASLFIVGAGPHSAPHKHAQHVRLTVPAAGACSARVLAWLWAQASGPTAG